MYSTEKNLYSPLSQTTYVLEKKIGKGTYGTVFLCHIEKNPEKKYAIKQYFKNINPNTIHLEISILSYLNKFTSDKRILKIYDGFCDNETGNIWIVTSYLENNDITKYLKQITIYEFGKYLFELLSCLKIIHEKGIIHRDLKPSNFIYNLKTNESLLIDFGLAVADMDLNKWEEINELNNNLKDPDYKFITDYQKNISVRHKIGTTGFSAPEVIFKSIYQNNKIDIWSSGVIFLCFMAQRFPIFNLSNKSKIDVECIKEIEPLILVYGKKNIEEISKIFGNVIFIGNEFDHYQINDGIKGLFKIKAKNNEEKKIFDSAENLLKKMLELNPNKRISAKDALEHEFFKLINKKDNK